MRNRLLLLLVCFFGGFSLLVAQTQYTPERYFIRFSDKKNSTFDISQPQAFLSKRALERRANMDISIDTNDLPVNKRYLDSLKLKGALIHSTTKWLNGAVISMDTLSSIRDLEDLSFVRNIDTVYYSSSIIFNKKGTKAVADGLSHQSNEQDGSTGIYDYGYGDNQVSMLKLNDLHTAGYDGYGKWIAVIDAGFTNVDQMYSLRHLFTENRIISTRDFVDGDDNVFHSSFHGQIVLSIMASNYPGIFTGTAPGASYLLLRSEDVGSEYPVEELYWAAAAEYADSLGADIINSSLGYTTFDYNKLSYSREDLDGNTTYSTRAADIAASKGILVVNSAGNEGASSWFYIGAPADGDSVLTAGAVDQQAEYAGFSSKGPAFDGDIKPNVAAVGAQTVFLNSNDQVAMGNGTSFSSPIIAGSAACLWQAFPELTNMELKALIEQSSSQFLNPDSLLGYGIPDFQKAALIYQAVQQSTNPDAEMKVMPNPFQNKLFLISSVSLGADAQFELYDLNGRVVKRLVIQSKDAGAGFYTFEGLNSLKQGMYILRISDNKIQHSLKLFKAG